MQRLDLYIATSFLKGCAPVLLLLGGLFSFLTLAEELEEVGNGTYLTSDAIEVVLLTLPRRAIDLLPVTALLGCLLGLGALANQQEIIVYRATGFSPRRFALPVLLVASALALLVAILQLFAVPEWERQAASLRLKASTTTQPGNTDNEFWTRNHQQIVRVGQVRYGRMPSDIEIYTMNQNGQLAELLQAERADVIKQGTWLVHNVRRSTPLIKGSSEQFSEQITLDDFLSAEQLSDLIVPVEALAPTDLYRYIDRLEQDQLNTHRYRVILWQHISLPVGLLAMSLLAIPFLMGPQRGISAGYRVAIGGGIGIAFYFVEQITGNLAVLFELDPAPTALAPDAALLGLATVILYRIR